MATELTNYEVELFKEAANKTLSPLLHFKEENPIEYTKHIFIFEENGIPSYVQCSTNKKGEIVVKKERRTIPFE
jgi:hypothetical protein